MELSFLLFKQMVSMMLMILMGIILVKCKVIKKEDSRVIAAITLYVVNPCLVISSLQIEFTKERFNGLILALTVAVLAHIVYIFVTYFICRLTKYNEIERASMIYSNGGNLIVPLVFALLGETKVFYCCAFIMVQTVLFWTHLVRMIGGSDRANIKKIITNPNMIAIVVGIVLFIFKIRLPEILGVTVSNIGAIVGPLTMLMLGMIMAEANLKETFLSVHNWFVCLMRLVILPFLIIVLVRLSTVAEHFSFAKDVIMIVILAVCAPVAVTVTQMADLFQNHEKQAGAINVMSVMLSIVSMPLMLALYQSFI